MLRPARRSDNSPLDEGDLLDDLELHASGRIVKVRFILLLLFVQEKDLDIFVAKLSDILRAPEKLTQMAHAARSVAKPEATKKVADCVLEIARG